MRKQLQWLFVSCLLAISQMAQSVGVSGEQILREHATSVTDTTNWVAHAHHTFGWVWLSDRKVLFARYNDNEGTDTYCIRDVQTGKETRLTRLTKLIHGFRVCNAPQVSPNGKWMLMDTKIGDNMELIALDGSRHFLILRRNPSPVWLPDSRHFLIPQDEDNPRDHACFLYDVATPLRAKKISHLWLSPDDMRRGVYRGSSLLTIDDNADDSENKVTIHQRAFKPKARSDRRTVVRMPKGAKLKYASLSPSAMQVFYVLNVKRTAARRLSPSQSASLGATKSQAFMEIWISDIRGRNLRHLISLPKDQADEEALHSPLYVEWLPGGKSLAVEYRWTLYTIPVK